MKYYYLDPITKNIYILDTEEDRQGLSFIGSSKNPNHKMAASRMLPNQSGFKFLFSFSVVSQSAQTTDK